MKQDKADKIIKKAELKAKKAAQQVEVASKKAEAAKKKQAEQAQKKAAKAADAATKKAAQKTKKADAAAKKAQLAAKKAEEKKAKAVAKAAAKAAGAGKPAGEGEEGEGGAPAAGKKKGKKKLLLIAIPVIAVAVGAGAFFFLRGGGEEEEEGPPEPISAPVEYVLNERSITALPVWGDEVLVYREELTPEPTAEPEDGKDGEAETISDSGEEGEESGEAEPAETEPEAEEEVFTKILYRYEGLQNPGSLVAAYTAVMTTEDAGFSTVDETLLRIDPPEFEGLTQGSVQLARNVPETEETAAGVQSLLLSWDTVNCSVLLDMPEGRVHDPKPEVPVSAGVRRGLSDLEEMHPSQLGLPGDSMEEYELMPQEGSVRIAGSTCMRVNIYNGDSQIVGSYFVSSDGKLYRLEEEVNGVVELEWE